ncbi:hypothetical protein CK203_051824 [Vitis vinifera]|uniref:Retrotransposon gag domain-containing protein n=1 Tax=Vitis vinifera TaxID=29760 RepID=A0A438GUP1_VITVI|nr:hypothetical protein CK203_051824 [Vitis vinifera]
MGCPRLHLRLYSTVMRAHGLDESQMITLFPLSLSGAAQRWFASLESSRRRTPSERDQIQMVLRSLQPRIARHVVGILPLVILREETFVGPRPVDVSAISSSSQRPPRRYQPTYQAQPLALPYYATQGIERPPVSYTATGQPCYAAQDSFTDRHAVEPGSSEAHRGRLLTALTPRPPPQPYLLTFKMDLHCAYHQGLGHETDRCTALRHAIQDLIDQGLVHLGQPSVTQNPLPAHTTHAVPPLDRGIHFLDFADSNDHVCMMSWDDMDPDPIELDDIYEMSSMSLGLRLHTVMILRLRTFSYILRGGRVLRQPPPTAAARPLGGTSSQEEVRAEDDEILRQLQSTWARISIWSLLASSSTHRDALTRALSQSELIPRPLPRTHSYDDGWQSHLSPSSIRPSRQWLDPERMSSGHRHRSWVLRIPTSFNLLLGRPWIHRAGAIPSSLHQKVKFIHESQVVVVTVGKGQLLSWGLCRDFVAMSFDQHGSTVVLDIMRGMSYSTRHGVGPTSAMDRASSSPFLIMTDHLGSGSSPLRLIIDIWHDCTGRGASEPHASSDGIIRGLSTTQEAELQHLVQQFAIERRSPWPFDSALIAPSSPDRTSLMTLCFPDETDEHGTFAEVGDIVDGAAPHDVYIDEMLALSQSQIEETIQPGLASSFDLFGVFVIELAEESLTALIWSVLGTL